MASHLQIQNKSKLIENKAREIFLRIKKDYDQGNIKSQTEYLYQIYHGIQDFYNSIGKPTMQAREALGPPFSSDYNSMMDEIHTDVLALYAESDQLANTLTDGFRQVEIDRQSLNNRIKKVEDRMKEVSLKLKQTTNEVIFRDSFVDQAYFEKEMVEGTPANIWTREGLLTLQPTVAESYVEEAVIRILEGNGLPGNTKQVRSLSGQLKFVGEENLHINLAEILDGNSDTWFEYETFEVSEATLEEVANIGFAYREGVKWTTEPGSHLRLLLEIELPYARTVNWLSLNPFIPNDKGANPPVIKSVKVYDGKGKVTEVSEKNRKNSASVEQAFMFSKQRCKRIAIEFEQTAPYETMVGHLFFKELDEKSANFMDRNREKSGKRIAGRYPSIENLGVKYDAEKNKIIQPSAIQGEVIPKQEQRKQNLFLPPVGGQHVQVGFESIPAWRYVIGVRDFSISNYQFEQNSGYISAPFKTGSSLQGVTLVADTYIPEEFGEGEWIKFDISVDDGQSWHPIHTRGTSKVGAKVMYLFNSNTPKEGRLDQFGYIDALEDIKEVRLRITLSRPSNITDAEFYTPIVKDYQLHVITQGEII